MVEQREHDLIAGPEFAPERAAHGESQRRHVRAENDFIRIAIQKIAHRRPRFRDHAVGVAAGVVSAARVGVVARQIIRDGVNHPLRHLRATRAVQKNRRMSVSSLRERRELRANPGEVERGGRRRSVFSDWHSRHSNSGPAPRQPEDLKHRFVTLRPAMAHVSISSYKTAACERNLMQAANRPGGVHAPEGHVPVGAWTRSFFGIVYRQATI